MDLPSAAERVATFTGASLTERIAELESALKGSGRAQVRSIAPDIDTDLIVGAAMVKKVAGQINVVIHTAVIVSSLPHILEEGEVIEALSLGAGNTGKTFDLETDRRAAEFKFIQWRGGPESIRQNSIFQDFFNLAEAETQKKKFLYLLELDRPLKFFRGGRALTSVMSKNAALSKRFEMLYGDRFSKVGEYFAHRQDQVSIVDLTAVVPGLAANLTYGLV